MNEQLQAQITTILQQMSAAGDVAIRQLPDIARQYIVYGFWRGLLGTVISVSFTIACIVFLVMIPGIVKKYEDDELYTLFIPGGCVTVLSFIIAYHQIENLILNVFAPKVWLLLEIKSLLD
jgi:hypothetical protein